MLKEDDVMEEEAGSDQSDVPSCSTTNDAATQTDEVETVEKECQTKFIVNVKVIM